MHPTPIGLVHGSSGPISSLDFDAAITPEVEGAHERALDFLASLI